MRLSGRAAVLLFTVLWLISALAGWAMCHAAHAKAEIGGEVPSPGDCGYPFVGNYGLDGLAVYHYFCSGPTEINGSHYQVIFGGTGGNVAVTAGINLAVFDANVALGGAAGVLEGISYWACPDLSQAEEPNPVGTWQGGSNATNPVKRSKCKTIGPYPGAGLTPLPGGPPAP